MSIALTDFNAAAMAEALELKPFQGRQLFRWIHGKRIFDPGQMTNLSKDLRARLARTCVLPQIAVLRDSASVRSGTRKALFQLADGETVEAVLLRDRQRITLCLSSQVGCAVKCSFCATGLAGFRRNLSPGEIVEQALHLLADIDLGERTPNIVYMGMGEAFRNYDAVISSIRLLMEEEGLGIGARKIAVSTAGDAKHIERFAGEDWQVRLSVSLHAANDALRSKLVPLNRRYPLARLRKALETYQGRTGRQFTFEWTLLDGVNDRLEDVRELVRFSEGLRASVNLIPWNPVEEAPYAASSRANCEAFRDALTEAGITATLRQERGQDIEAACGQLRRIHEGEESAPGASPSSSSNSA